MSRKGQIAGQVLIYVMGLVIISLVVIFGYRAIRDFVTRSEDLALVDFRTKLTNTIEEMSSDYGSMKIVDFTIPKGFSRICFLNRTASPDTRNLCRNIPDNPDYEPIVCSFWKDNSKENAFLLGKKTEAFFIGNENTGLPYFVVALKGVTEEEGYLCPDITNSRIKLRIEGKGRYAELSQG
ncbi:hypothetical protein JXA85_08245 [Candidatus Woesearchaeota archaeon]|nr:hypothetical protein [Candidatus Woesearchaeota archaeon]